jgi:carbon starvation protein
VNAIKRQSALISVAVAGALIAWAVSRFTHERFNAVALLVAAFSFYYLGARFYSAFIAARVLKLDDANVTPAHRLRDNRDYMPFRRWTLFGMHFAWIAGPGPLIGPTLAAQFGFLPGFVWIVLGAVLMGCVQDMVILCFSTRRDGMSLARMIKNEVSPFGGFIASLAVLLILEILLGVLALTVVNALKGSPWGTFTIASSIPIAFLVGWYMTKLRPGHEGQATAIGVALLIVATGTGYWAAANPFLKSIFNRTDAQLAVAIVIYGFLASALPAWMLLAPRDNISTYLKVGTVVLLAIGILFAQPVVHMPAVTKFADGSGPVVAGGLFPFCFIIIACGAISGFHSLISSGITPRLVDRESDIRPVAYGAMLTESFVGVMALIAAVTLVPGIYLAMNHPPLPGAPAKGKPSAEYARMLTAKISRYDPIFAVTPEQMSREADEVKEDSLYNRTGGAPSLAVGMARIFTGTLGGGLIAFWYHFAIMFEAVFILTVLDSGTRVIRFIVHEMLHDLAAMRVVSTPPFPPSQGGVSLESPPSQGGAGGGAQAHPIPVWLTSGLAVLGWGLILAWGIVDKEGGTRALFKMFGTANQLLAVIALTLATVVMLKRRRSYVWVTGLPLIVLGIITLTAAFQSVFSPIPNVGAIAAAHAASNAKAVANAYLTAILTGMLIVFVVTVLVISAREAFALWRKPAPELQPLQGR